MTLSDRFESKYIPEPNSGCWLWLAGPYVQHRYESHDRPTISDGGTPKLAHRVAWELYRGPIPDGLQVLHRCDMPFCVNPDHLFLGVNLDNMVDRDAKGRRRTAVGEASPRAKLTAPEVREIRMLHGYVTQVALAEVYGVSRRNIRAIQNNQSWRHLP